MTPTARQLPDGDVGLWVHYDDRDLAKAIPGAHWDPDLRCWRIPVLFAWQAQDVVDLLTATNVEDNVRTATQRLMAALPPDLRAPTWRALAQVWHPDHGGDPRAMRALLAERVSA